MRRCKKGDIRLKFEILGISTQFGYKLSDLNWTRTANKKVKKCTLYKMFYLN